jgi:lysophospholipase
MIRAYGHQQIFDFAHNTIEGMDDNSAKALLNMVRQMLDAFRTRADDVANWPSVRSFSRS